MVKAILKNICIVFTRFVYNFWCKLCFFSSGSIAIKPKHIKNRKYIHLGKKVFFDAGVRLDCYENEGEIPNLTIGDNCTFCFNCTLLCTTNLIIGKDCMFASDVMISTENHNLDPTGSYRKGKLVSKDVTIGEGCWVGEKVVILPGVRIGDKCIIGAGSIVTKDVPPYCIAVGNPARVVKKYDLVKAKFVEVSKHV